jgi:flagellin
MRLDTGKKPKRGRAGKSFAQTNNNLRRDKMAVTVQTNMGALTALKNLNTNTANMNKSLERLSSGFRINSAADDAAGYAVSAKLSGERGKLEAASQNALQATAMVKTADAGINEIENMVRRLQVLATQAASANNAGDIAKLDAERATLVSQIDKIANSTKYNGVAVLNGSSGSTASGTGSIAAATGIEGITLSGATPGTTYNATYTMAGANFAAGDSIILTNAADATDTQTVVVAALPTGLNAATVDFANLGISLTINAAITANTGAAGTVVVSAGSSSTFQVGAENGGNNQVTADFTNNYTTTGLAIGTVTADISTAANAQTYLTEVTAALNTLTTNRAALGSTVNQLGYVNANLSTNIEQLSSAISTIKDADMAAEMANFTKSQVLVQAGTAMLAQANQSSQNVLSLFR